MSTDYNLNTELQRYLLWLAQFKTVNLKGFGIVFRVSRDDNGNATYQAEMHDNGIVINVAHDHPTPIAAFRALMEVVDEQ